MLITKLVTKEVPGIGGKIASYRKASTKSLTQLAAEAGISVPHWHRIEKEKINHLPVDTLRGIEKALEVNLGVSFDS